MIGGEAMETVIIGNKNDLPDDDRQVSTLEGEELAAELNIPFLETSALTGNNVEVFLLYCSFNIYNSKCVSLCFNRSHLKFSCARCT